VGDGSVTCEKPCGRGFHREDGCYCIGMRIAQVAPRGKQPWSGVLTVIVHLAAALARRGHRVDVWQLHEWPPDDSADQHRLLQAAGVVQVPVRSSLARMGRDELAERGRAALLSSHRYDRDAVAESYEAVYERAGESRPRVTP
jgi:hypothetical protein